MKQFDKRFTRPVAKKEPVTERYLDNKTGTVIITVRYAHDSACYPLLRALAKNHPDIFKDYMKNASNMTLDERFELLADEDKKNEMRTEALRKLAIFSGKKDKEFEKAG